MPITSIIFAKAGDEPKPKRNTRASQEIERIKTAMINWIAVQPNQPNLIINLDGKVKHERYGISRRLTKTLDPKKYNVYGTGTQIVIQRLESLPPLHAGKK
jgi:hypothetical protein